MKKQSRLSPIEVVVIIFVLVFGVYFWGSAFIRPTMSSRVVCGTNLKGLGTALMVYSFDYDGHYPQLPGNGTWSRELGFDYDLHRPDFTPGGAQHDTPRTVTASWYLLVREADISPKSFVCPESRQTWFDGANSNDLDAVELWDFGPTPHKHVSYAMHHPYGKYPAHSDLGASFAVAADMSPWFNEGDIVPPGADHSPPQIIKLTDEATWPLGNSPTHRQSRKQLLDGQNVLYADGHTSFETQPNVGVDQDNIFTFWSTDDNPTEQDIQGGTPPTGRTPDNDAKSETDSFLVI